MDPEDVAAILGSEKNFSSLQQNRIKTLLQNKQDKNLLHEKALARKDKINELKNKKQQEIDKAKAKILADKKKYEREQELIKLRARLKANNVDPKEQAITELRLKKLQYDVQHLGEPKTMTEYQKQVLQNQQERIKKTAQKEQYKQDQDVVGMEEDIMANAGASEVYPLMDYINQTQNKSYYYGQWPEGDNDFIPFNTTNVGGKVPLITKKNHKLTMDIVRKSAAANDMTIEEFLAAPGIGILIKGDDNVYRPANR